MGKKRPLFLSWFLFLFSKMQELISKVRCPKFCQKIRVPGCNCGAHYPRRLAFFVTMTAVALITAILLVLTVTLPALDKNDGYLPSTCHFACKDCADVYVPAVFPSKPSPADALGRVPFLLRTDSPYAYGQQVPCWYALRSLNTTTLSTAQLLNQTADFPPAANCLPLGFVIACNSTEEETFCAVLGATNQTVWCPKKKDKAQCLLELSQFFPADATFLCGFVSDVTLQLSYSGFTLIVEGFLLTFALLGLSGVILSSIISPHSRNSVRCCNLFDL